MIVLGSSAIVFADAFVKKWAYTTLYDKHHGKLGFIKGVLGFNYTENTGAAWSMLKNAPWIFISISLVMVVVITVYFVISEEKNLLLRISLVMIAGGGIGNLIDRLFRTGSKFGNRNGFVVDMFNFEFIDFPVFNVADVFVCVGSALFILYMLIYGFSDKKTQKADKNE